MNSTAKTSKLGRSFRSDREVLMYLREMRKEKGDASYDGYQKVESALNEDGVFPMKLRLDRA